MRLLLLSLFVAAATAMAPSIYADRGVGVNVGVIEVADQLSPGGGYHLPELTILNTGDEVTSYDLSIGFIDGQSERRPSEKWFSFSEDGFILEPGASREVTVSIDVPADAQAGEYFALVRAQTVVESPSGGAGVGAAVATKLSFSVESTGWLDAQRHRVNRWIDDAAPWIYLLPAAALLAVLATKAHRLPFRLRVERK